MVPKSFLILFTLSVTTVSAIYLGSSLPEAQQPQDSTQEVSSFIVQAATASEARALVEQHGGTVTQELSVINGVGALLTADQVAQLQSKVRITPDRGLVITGKGGGHAYGALATTTTTVDATASVDSTAIDPDLSTDGTTSNWSHSDAEARPTYTPTWIGANKLHAQGIMGAGVGIVGLDSGIQGLRPLRLGPGNACIGIGSSPAPLPMTAAMAPIWPA